MNAENSRPKVSIIITCYNLRKYIGEAIESLLRQECDFSYEIIVIDDASSDGSPEIIRNFTDEKIRCIFLTENVGAARAINLAYAAAKGEYFCRFDGDDKWYPDYLRKAAAILDKYPEISLVHSDVSFIDSMGDVTSERKNINRPAFLKPADHEFESILRRYYINAPAIMARKSSWDTVLPWREEFKLGLGDWFCTLGMLENAKSYFIDEPLAYYRIHTTNMHRSMIVNGAAEKNTLIILEYFKKRKNTINKQSWNNIYFTHFRELGFSYYFHDMESDARRCLNNAFKYDRIGFLKNRGAVRIWLALLIGKKLYNRLKMSLK